MNFNAVSKRVVYKKSSPWHGTAIIRNYARSFQFCAQVFHVRAFKTKVPVIVRASAIFFHRNMNVEATGIEPNAAANTYWFRLRNFSQT